MIVAAGKETDAECCRPLCKPPRVLQLRFNRHFREPVIGVFLKIQQSLLIGMGKTDDASVHITFQQFGTPREPFFMDLKGKLVRYANRIIAPDNVVRGISPGKVDIIVDRILIVRCVELKLAIRGYGEMKEEVLCCSFYGFQPGQERA